MREAQATTRPPQRCSIGRRLLVGQAALGRLLLHVVQLKSDAGRPLNVGEMHSAHLLSCPQHSYGTPCSADTKS